MKCKLTASKRCTYKANGNPKKEKQSDPRKILHQAILHPLIIHTVDLFHHISSYFHKDHKHINREHYIALSNTCNRDIGSQTLGRDSGPNPRTG